MPLSSPRNRSRSRERHGLRADASGPNEFEDGCRRPSGHGGAQGDPRARVDGARRDHELSGSVYSTGHRAHSSSPRDNSRRRKAISAIADKTPELAKTLAVRSGGETGGKDTYLLGPPVRAPALTDAANGAASRGTIGNALHPTPNLHRGRTAATTTAVTTRETVSRRIGSLGHHLRRARSGESPASPSAAWPAAPAGHPQTRSN